jgi:hypothetical protein
MPFLLYPYLLLVSSLIFIFAIPEKKEAAESAPEEK